MRTPRFAGFLEVLLDRERRVDYDGGPGPFVSDEVGSTTEVVVDELREDHDALTLAALTAISLEARYRDAATAAHRRS